MKHTNYSFFLGGHDLEMLTIKDLLTEEKQAFFDKFLKWGAKASDYEDEILQVLARGGRPVLIELELDLPELNHRLLFIDHHGEDAKEKPSALEQVFKLLALPESRWTRHLDLVAANDVSHVRAMQQRGASQEEMKAVRHADREAQGITQEQEVQAQEAMRHLRVICDGKLTVVVLPHNKTAAVADTLDKALGGPGFENLLILSPQETNFYGAGDVVDFLHAVYGGWKGGSLPKYGFWGSRDEARDIEKKFVQSY
jgi:hypothetical protein